MSDFTFFINFLNVNVNYSSLTLEDLDHPILTKFYLTYWDITIFITTMCFILMLYTIIKKSSVEMGGYKWYLCHQLCWSYAFELYMGIWKPIPLWPFYLGYSGGFLRPFPDLFSINIISFLANGMGFSIGISLFHRYVQASPLSNYYARYQMLFWRGFTYAIIFCSLEGLPIFLQFFGQFDNIILRQSFKDENISVSEIFFKREPSIFGYNPKLTNNYTVFGMAVIISMLIGVLIFMVILYFNYIRILLKNKNNLSAATYKLQKVLFKILYIQFFLIAVLLILPFMISLILAMFGIKWSSIFAMVCFMLISTHALADCIVLIYYVKPYRFFVIELLKFLLNKFGFKFVTSTVQPMIISTTVPDSENL